MNKHLDEIYADTRRTRDSKLGHSRYQEYLESQHWLEVKRKAKSRPNYRKCEFCESRDVELHHTSYKWIKTDQELRCIISLCRQHHQEVHDLAKSSGLSVRLATNKMRKVYKEDYKEKNR